LSYSQTNLYNVKDYGTKGDAVTDDFEAINNLINRVKAKIFKDGEKTTILTP